MSRGLVIIPTYNEKDNIQSIIDAVLCLHISVHILVVDDNSPDGTANLVLEKQKIYNDKLHLLVRQKKEGLGPAYTEGFRWALEHFYDFIFEMDADFSHQPKNLIVMYKKLEEGFDLVIGSRYHEGINVINWPIGRVLLSYFASKYVKIITGMKIDDPTSGFVGYRASLLQVIVNQGLRFKGYAFQVETKFIAWKYKANIIEITNVFINRKKGVSKMSKAIVLEAICGVFQLKWRSFF